MEKLAFTIREVVEAGGGSRTVVYEAIKSGALNARKRGKSTIILAPDFIQYLEDLPDFLEQATA